MKEQEKWIQSAIKHKGSLRKALQTSEPSRVPTLRKKAQLAETLKMMSKK